MSPVRFRRNLGLLLLAVWLVIYGVMTTFGITFQGSHIVLGILAIIAGVLVFVEYQ